MSSAAWGSWMVPLLRHLWQSTVFAGGVWALALALRRNGAWLRYRLWMIASVKFLLPLSLLIAAGARLASLLPIERTQPRIATVVEGVSQPWLQAWPADAKTDFAVIGTAATAANPATNWLPVLLVGLWAAGTLLLLGRWTKSWLELRALVRRGEPMTLADGTPALLVAESVEPGIVGILRPVLVLPRGIAERLSAEQLEAVVAHELSHLRRRDNLTAALHMAVEAMFWFHPLVWWLGTRLVEERERACDEAVLEGTRRPFAYAEGILNVCKFYVEVPLSCVSGVTGSELKQRIARILSGQCVRKLDVRRKALLAAAGVLALGMPLMLGAARAARAPERGPAQAAAPSPVETGSITGTWQGTAHLPNGRDARFVLKITRDDKGALSATAYALDQMGGPPITGDSVHFEGGTLRFVNTFPGLTYEGKMSPDRNSISGTATQNGTFALVLERATPDTEWALPAPPPRTPPMAADAKPDVEVSTVKPTQPGTGAFMISMRGGELSVKNQTLNDLIKFAYEVQDRQIAGGAEWIATDRWDIEAKPDTPGMPSKAQVSEMVQKLLAERFALKVHEEKREMAAYVLTVGKDGPKLVKSTNPSGLTGFTMGPLGVMHAGSATTADLARVLQSGILDRPVIDETGLEGRWDFTLQWTPDETQFVGMPVRVPAAPADEANAPPPLFTAIQEQLGLKLEAQKADVPVVVIDHAERPSPN
jgi:uncharacterized protein (TIGR03435 family)